MDVSTLLAYHKSFKNLMATAASGQLSHALLFYGPEGNGSLPAALELSRFLLCENNADGHACGSCSACLKNAKYIHPDLHFVFPVINTKDKAIIYKDRYTEWREALQENPFLGYYEWISKISGENKQGNISAKACNEILRDLSMKAYQGDVKIGIFWLVEYLGREGNRLLKMIEEPPDNTFLFLIAQKREAILPTVRSRCQQVYLGLLPDAAIKSALMHEFELPDAQAENIAMLAQGNWNEALNIHNHGNIQPLDLLKGWIKAAWHANAALISEQCDAMQSMNREEQKHLLVYCLRFFEKLLWRLSGLSAENEYPAEKPVLDFMMQKLDIDKLDRLRSMCEENLESISFNANQRIMWMDATLRLRDLFHNRTPIKAS